MNILTALVERAGDIVSRDDLMARAWPSTFVDGSNLKVNVAAVRRVLERSEPRRRYIATVSGHGYRFVEAVHAMGADKPVEGHHHNLPPSIRMIGRDDAMAKVAALLGSRPLVTVKGTGGVGKTTLALAVAHAALPRCPDGVWMLDIGAVEDGRYAANALAQQIGLTIHSDDPAAALAAAIKSWRALILLDGCEHALEQAARFCELVRRSSSDIQILATSREPMRVAGESVFDLRPLRVPPPESTLTEAEALQFPAVELFVERASASSGQTQFGSAGVAAIVDICRRLDGVPLAVELAATRIEALSPGDLLRTLGDRFDLLDRGRRAGPPRHRSLSATLDWSHDLLSPAECVMFRRLSVFHGRFGLSSALAVGTFGGSHGFDPVAILADLVSKSLITTSADESGLRYRYLDATRAYGLRKLAESDERDAVHRRHAVHCRELCGAIVDGWSAGQPGDVRSSTMAVADNVRAALNWAFSEHGDAALGLSLTAVAIPLWEKLSFVQELVDSVERALPERSGEAGLADRDALLLCASLAAALLQARGPLPRVEALWRRALELSERLGDVQGRLQALWGLCDLETWSGDHRSALALADRIRAAAAQVGDRVALVAVERPTATSRRYLGELQGARHAAERLLFRSTTRIGSRALRLEGHVTVAARGTLANVLWLQGFPARARENAQRALAEAEVTGRAFALTNALAHTAIPIALHVGDTAAAEQALDRLSDHVAGHALRIWQAMEDCLGGIVLLARGDANGLGGLRDGLDELQAANVQMRRPAYLGSLASGLGAHGHMADAAETIGEALVLSERNGEHWCRPELLRIKGELLLSAASGGERALARTCFREAIDLAGRQGALMWCLRAATSLAAVDRETEMAADSLELLSSVTARFTEGFDTPDFRAAQSQLAGRVAEHRPIWPVALA